MDQYTMNASFVKPDFQQLAEFWPFIRPGDGEYLEIRFTDSQKPQKFYRLLREWQIHTLHHTVEPSPIYVVNGCQVFLKYFEELKSLLEYNNYYFTRYFKICYGLNARVMDKDNKIGGKYDNIERARFIFFDIDKKDHTDLNANERKEMLEFVKTRVLRLGKYLKHGFKLDKYILISSGGGYHVLYPIEPQKITDAKKRWFKEFVKEYSKRVSKNSKFIADPIHDLTRVFALPETMNVKREVKVQMLEHIEYKMFEQTHQNDFKLHSRHKRKKQQKDAPSPAFVTSLRQSLEWRILTDPDVPQGEINTTVLFATKLLMKKLGIVDYEDYEAEMNEARGTSHNLNPYYSTDNKEYSPFIIINWCKRNHDWCVKNGIDYEKYKAQVKVENDE